MNWFRGKAEPSTLVCSNQKLEGGILSITGNMVLYRHCHFKGVEVRVRPDCRERMFQGCWFEDCPVVPPEHVMRDCMVAAKEAA